MKLPFHPSQLGQFVLVATIAAIIGSGSYSFWSWQERKNPADLEKVILGLGCFLAALFVLPALMFVYWLWQQGWWATLVLLPIPAGWLHYRLGKASLSWFAGIVFMSAVFSTGVAAAVFLLFLIGIYDLKLAWRLIWRNELNLLIIYFASLYFYILVAPVANWVLSGLKAKPGVEVHLEQKP